MSEQAPRTNSFEANKAAYQAEQDDLAANAFKESLYGEANVTDFTDTDQNPDAEYPEDQRNAKKQYEEGNAYEQHLKRLANGVDRQEELYNKPSAGYGKEWDEAIATNEALDAAKVDSAEAKKQETEAAEAALEAKLASSPELRRLDGMSQEIHDLRNGTFTEDDEAEKTARLKQLEVKFNELLNKYEKSDEYDLAIASVLWDRSDMEALDMAAENALIEKRKADQEAEVARAAAKAEAESIKLRPEEENSELIQDKAEAWTMAEAADEMFDKKEAEKQAAIDEAVAEALANNPSGRSLGTFTQVLNRDTLLRNAQNKRARHPDGRFEEPTEAELDTARAAAFNEAAERANPTPGTPEAPSYSGVAFARSVWDRVLRRKNQESRPQDATNEKRGFLKNKRLALIIGGVGLTAAAVGIGMAHEASQAKNPTEHVDTTSEKAAVTPVSNNEKSDSETGANENEILNSTAWNIPAGSGGEALMNRFHVDKSVWYANEAEFAKKFPGQTYYDQTGHVRLSDAGKLPLEAIKFWAPKIEDAQK